MCEEIKKIADELGISEDNINYDNEQKKYIVKPKIAARLKLVKFNVDYPISFEKCDFAEPIIHSEKIFNQDIAFILCNFEKRIMFNDVTFRQKVAFFGVTFREEVDFAKVQFDSKIFFTESYFENTAYFLSSSFNDKANFTSIHFLKYISFEGSVFKKEALFVKCIANSVFSLFQCKFEKLPNFSGAFIDRLNLTNTDFDLHNIAYQDVIKSIHRYYVLTNKEQTFIQNAVIFRDSFRLFKNALIKDNNLLDASNWHKLELYCKEIELNSKKPKMFSREWVDKWILRFYRHTSDHHTDLIKILNNVLMLIALFGIFSFGMFCFTQEGHIGYAQETQTIWYILGKIPLSSHFSDYWDCGIFLELILIGAICFAFVVIFLILLCLRQYEWFKAIMALCLMGDVLILALKPALLLPIFGKLLDESLKVNFPAFTSLSVIYAILMFLLIFSLQKTARKNSIVPH